MPEKVYIGTARDDFEGCLAGENIYLTKHTWDCGWYWGFGYIGNGGLHTHFDRAFLNINKYTPDEIFTECVFDSKIWWVLRDLFKQAYALKNVAEVYRYGGHQTTVKGITDIICDSGKAAMINKDLEKILDAIWDIVKRKERNTKMQKEKDMSANEYQRLAMVTASPAACADPILNAVLGLAGEGGEIADRIKKQRFQNHAQDYEKLKEELGDVCWYVALMATGLGVPLSDIFSQNVEKLKKRYPEGFSSEKSINREV